MRRGENAKQAGQALARQRGSEYMREIGRRGGEKGGKTLAQSRGPAYMRKIGAHGAKHRAYPTGWQHSEATKKKMRAAQRQRWAGAGRLV